MLEIGIITGKVFSFNWKPKFTKFKHIKNSVYGYCIQIEFLNFNRGIYIIRYN